MRPEPVVKILSKPWLNVMDETAFEVNRERMSGVRLSRRPVRDCEGRAQLRYEIDAEERKEHLE